ncbi:decarboxylase-like protein [Colletotrichum plurivorum]|uniref:Decarboxylase-like protein n=1 Tax=Colletotrichum plurivorum TaxID=2175906 RepID=A0A8H6KUG3_9PEZI|nr:decarboxylase-like protein [Colletotrichum plurivorum]
MAAPFNLPARAIDALNEVEDSQALLDHYVSVYGIDEQLSSTAAAAAAAVAVTSATETQANPPKTNARHGNTFSTLSSWSIEFPTATLRRRFSGSRFRGRDLSLIQKLSAAGYKSRRREQIPQQASDRESLSVASPVSAAATAATATGAGGQDPGPNPQTSTALSDPIDYSTAANFPSLPPQQDVDGDAIELPTDTNPAPCTGDDSSRPPQDVNVSPPSPRPKPFTKTKMSVSEQSPTQDNDDRDYENYYEEPSFVQTSPIFQDAATQNHTPPDGDSQIVTFDNIAPFQPPLEDTQNDDEPSSIQEDAGPTMEKGSWRRSSSQQQSSLQRPEGGFETPLAPTAPLPQTPANSKNPFAGMNKLGDAALVGSQLFGQTQFSSAVKHFSPTSSRPSPHVHNSISPNVAETSPLKNRYNVTSPMASSSPQITRFEPTEPNTRARTPSDNGAPEDGTVPESPQYATARPRTRPEPMSKYEKMADSQKRKLESDEVQGDTSGEESDDMGEALRRKRRAASKKRAAEKDLANIAVGRRQAPESIEVPSTTKKPRATYTGAGRYRTRRAETSLPTSDDADEFTVADSQGQTTAEPDHSKPSPDLADSAAGMRQGLVSSNDAVPDSAGATQKSVPNGVIPGTESSENSARLKDMIPETSPNNTQSRPQARSRSSSNEPLAASKGDALAAPDVPTDATAEMNHVDMIVDTPPHAPAPSRRSSRKPRPTLKAQSINTASARAATSSEAMNAADSATRTKTSAPKNRVGAEPQPGVQPEPTSQHRSIPAAIPVLDDEPPMPSSPPVPKSQPRANGLSGLAVDDETSTKVPVTPGDRASPTADEPPGSTSTLSVLTTTPVRSQESVELPPLSPDKPTRGRKTTKSLPRLTTEARVAKSGTRRLVRRATRLDSGSTDELTRSPSVNGFENSIIQPPRTAARGNRLSMLSHASNNNLPGLFSGMAFAISFQSRKDGERTDQYEHRLEQSREVEKMITQSGGHLLANGFDELFEPHALRSRSTSPASESAEDIPLALTPWAKTMGFAALIADGHSRKVKYMQALALGLPCISDRWVTNCVAKRTVVDWIPYLLCAGQSTFLRDAIRSRYLAPYPATEARLTDVIGRRTKMLEGSKILLVMKRSPKSEDKKMPYVFLAQVLGATLSRAYNLDEARETMNEREDADDPFDWVYVDEHTGSEEGLFGTAAPPAPRTSRKRKRTAAPAKEESERPPKKIRTLSDELVIQSLILGRMIEEGEMEA